MCSNSSHCKTGVAMSYHSLKGFQCCEQKLGRFVETFAEENWEAMDLQERGYNGWQTEEPTAAYCDHS